MSETYSIPDAPQGVTRVRCTDDSGMSFALNTDGRQPDVWRGSNGASYYWHELLATWGEVEPIPRTPIEKAVEYFRVEGVPPNSDYVYPEEWSHAKVLIEDALSRG